MFAYTESAGPLGGFVSGSAGDLVTDPISDDVKAFKLFFPCAEVEEAYQVILAAMIAS